MELLGPTLFDKVVLHKRIPMETVLKVGLQLLDLLAFIHSKGIVHCDLKPENILLGLDSDPKKQTRVFLLDFGLARAFRNGETHVAFADKGSPTGTFLNCNGNCL